LLFGSADETVVSRRRSADLDTSRTHCRQDQKVIVADDREVTLEDIALVRVEPTIFLERYVAPTRAFVAIAVVLGKLEAPAITRFTSIWYRRFCVGRLACARSFLVRLGDGEVYLSLAAVDYHVLERWAFFLGLVADNV
jgi:hypothetical protein